MVGFIGDRHGLVGQCIFKKKINTFIQSRLYFKSASSPVESLYRDDQEDPD